MWSPNAKPFVSVNGKTSNCCHSSWIQVVRQEAERMGSFPLPPSPHENPASEMLSTRRGIVYSDGFADKYVFTPVEIQEF